MFNETLKSFIKMLKITCEVRPFLGKSHGLRMQLLKMSVLFIKVFFYIRNESIIKRQSFLI